MGASHGKRLPLQTREVIDERLRDHKRQTRSRIMFGFFTTAAYVFTISLLSFPSLLISFRPQSTGLGCILMLVYIFAWCLLLVGIASFVFGGPPDVFVGYFILFMFSYGGLISIFFTLSRKRGFRLTSPRRYRKENLVAQQG